MIYDFKVENSKIDLGIIKLFEDNDALDEGLVTGGVYKTVFKLDKRVFNIG